MVYDLPCAAFSSRKKHDFVAFMACGTVAALLDRRAAAVSFVAIDANFVHHLKIPRLLALAPELVARARDGRTRGQVATVSSKASRFIQATISTRLLKSDRRRSQRRRRRFCRNQSPPMRMPVFLPALPLPSPNMIPRKLRLRIKQYRRICALIQCSVRRRACLETPDCFQLEIRRVDYGAMSDDLPMPPSRSIPKMFPFNARRLVKLSIVAIALAVSSIACHIPGKSIESNYKNVDQFNFDVAMGPKNYHIEGYLTRSAEQGSDPDCWCSTAARATWISASR